MVNAAGEMIPPRAVFTGKRDMTKTKMKNLSKDGRTAEWKFSYSENGWVKQETFLDIIKDLGEYISTKGIQKPVLLFIDRASCHLSLAMAELCKELGIQPILLRPNSTHLCQALDVTFYSSLKARFKKEKEEWHRQPTNIGNSLNKYSVIGIVHHAAEFILSEKPKIISNGFQKAGIFSWNPEAPNMDCTTPSIVYSKEISTDTVLTEEAPCTSDNQDSISHEQSQGHFEDSSHEQLQQQNTVIEKSPAL